MKNLQISLPLAILSFSVFTKWWLVIPTDAPHSMMAGFPLPFVCTGWNTSLSIQFFIFEMLLDLLFYFSISFLAVLFFQRIFSKTRLPKLFKYLIWYSTVLALAFSTLVASNSDNFFYWKRHFEIEVLKTGFQVSWTNLSWRGDL